VIFDRTTGSGYVGGYVGHGVTPDKIVGRPH
jgi:hypothetical protein